MYYMYLKKERLESKMKKYIKAKELLESNANKKEKKPIYATRKLSIGLVSCMLGLVMATPVVNAEEANLNHPQQVQEENQPADNGVEDPDTNHAPVPLENDETSQEGPHKLETQDADVFEMSPEIMLNAVTKIDVKDPTVNPILYDDTAISGGSLAKYRDKVKKETIIATVHVTLKGKDGTVKANLSVTPTTGTTWKVDLPEGKKVEEGDTVTVYQQIGEDKSQEVTKTAQPSKASSVTLTMPTGEFWIEQYVANIVNADEKAEAIDLLKKANPDIAKDIKSVEFKITGVDPKVASYTVTYKDNSTTEEIPAPDLTVKKVTETSRSPEIDSITIVDNVIKGKLAGPGPFNGIKVQLIVNVNKDKAGQFCNENKCTFDKTSSTPVDVTVQDDGTFSYTLQAWDSLTLDQIVGVSVKEPHKFVSCSTTTVKPVTPEKTEVKDPRKLTGKDKEAIDAAIRKAYTLDGVSKLPNGTGDRDGTPAVIQFDDSGNAKIFDGNDVKGTFDSSYNFVPEKNEDGSYKLNDGAEPKITIPAKDLVKNIKPEPPTLAKSGNNITITPNEKDTDANIIAVSYKDKDGNDKTTKATKGDSGWTVEGDGSVDANGVISLPKDKVKGNTDVTATVTDKGGIADDDKTPLTSDSRTLTIGETIADKVNELGGLDPVVMKKWVGDTLDWKDGVKAKDSTKESEVNKLLAGATFTDATEEKRSTTKEGDFTGKVKVKFSDDSEIIVEKQMLYVSNNVTSMERKDKVPTDALDVEFKLGEGTKVDNTTSGAIEGNKDNPTSYSKYKVKPNTDLSTYSHPNLAKTIIKSINVTAQDTYVDPVWNDKNNGTNFVVTADNNVFTATATKTYDVTLKPNNGKDEEKDKVTTKKTGEYYELPAKNTFTPPNDNQEFSGWKIGDDTKLKQPGENIKVDGDKVISAVWKPIEFKVTFKTEDGATGEMTEQIITKGSDYQIPDPKFTPKEGKVFDGWKIDGQEGLKKAGFKIEKISGDVTLTATWKDIEYKVTFDGNSGTGSMDPATVKKGEKYKLPENTFGTPPDKQKFRTWEVDGKEVAPGTEITIEKDTVVKALWEGLEYKVTFDGNSGTGSMDPATVKKGEKYKLPENTFGTPPDKQKFRTWEVDGKEVAPGTEITIEKDTVVKAIWKDKPSQPDNPSNPSQPSNPSTPGISTPGTGTETPDNNPNTEDPKVNEKPSDPSKDKPAEPGKEKPSDPAKPGEEKPNTPSEKDSNKPGVKVPSRDDKKTPGKVEKGDKVIKKGDTEIVVPKEALTEENGKIKTEDRPKIVDKFKEKNPDLVDVKIHDNGNVSLSFKDGTRAELSAKDLRRDQGIKIPRKQSDVSPMKRAGKNAKTGIESVAGLVCTLVASTGALYIGRKKED